MEDQIHTLQNTPIAWQRAFIRSGFYFHEEGGKFNFVQENSQNECFLHWVLDELNQDYKDSIFSPSSPIVDEASWINAIEKLHTGSEGGPSGMHTIELKIMDT